MNSWNWREQSIIKNGHSIVSNNQSGSHFELAVFEIIKDYWFSCPHHNTSGITVNDSWKSRYPVDKIVFHEWPGRMYCFFLPGWRITSRSSANKKAAPRLKCCFSKVGIGWSVPGNDKLWLVNRLFHINDHKVISCRQMSFQQQVFWNQMIRE